MRAIVDNKGEVSTCLDCLLHGNCLIERDMCRPPISYTKNILTMSELVDILKSNTHMIMPKDKGKDVDVEDLFEI